jgi:hypothetical protein
MSTPRSPERRGWYDDPDGTGQLRYWDGSSWVRYWEGADDGRSPRRAVDVADRYGRAIAIAMLVSGAGFVVLSGLAAWGLVSTFGPAGVVPAHWIGVALVVRDPTTIVFGGALLGWRTWHRNILAATGADGGSTTSDGPAPALARRGPRPSMGGLRSLWATSVRRPWLPLGLVWVTLGVVVATALRPGIGIPVDTIDSRTAQAAMAVDLGLGLLGAVSAYVVWRVVRALSEVARDLGQ